MQKIRIGTIVDPQNWQIDKNTETSQSSVQNKHCYISTLHFLQGMVFTYSRDITILVVLLYTTPACFITFYNLPHLCMDLLWSLLQLKTLIIFLYTSIYIQAPVYVPPPSLDIPHAHTCTYTLCTVCTASIIYWWENSYDQK